jgi:hypothetical protein
LKRAEPIYGHAFEPDGKALWVAGDLTRYRALHRLVPGSAPVLIGGRGALSIDLAQDGSAVWSDARHDGDIELRRSGRDDWEAIARTNRYESQPEFSADGKHIALVSNRDGSESIVVYNMDSGTVLPLALEPRFRWVRPTWSARDQSLILTAYEDVETRLYRYRLDRGVLETVPNVEPGAFHGVELADRLFFLSGHRTRQSALMQLRPGHAQAEQLPFGIVQAYRASTRWLAWRREGSRALQVHTLALPEPDARGCARRRRRSRSVRLGRGTHFILLTRVRCGRRSCLMAKRSRWRSGLFLEAAVPDLPRPRPVIWPWSG